MNIRGQMVHYSNMEMPTADRPHITGKRPSDILPESPRKQRRASSAKPSSPEEAQTAPEIIDIPDDREPSIMTLDPVIYGIPRSIMVNNVHTALANLRRIVGDDILRVAHARYTLLSGPPIVAAIMNKPYFEPFIIHVNMWITKMPEIPLARAYNNTLRMFQREHAYFYHPEGRRVHIYTPGNICVVLDVADETPCTIAYSPMSGFKYAQECEAEYAKCLINRQNSTMTNIAVHLKTGFGVLATQSPDEVIPHIPNSVWNIFGSRMPDPKLAFPGCSDAAASLAIKQMIARYHRVDAHAILSSPETLMI